MSFIDPNAFYEEELLLLDKNIEAPTTITDGQVINGDLTPFRHRIEAVNTGNQLQNNGILTLRIPPDGTFVRKEPILIDESAKDDYIIQFRVKQDRDKDGIFEEEGKLFRFFIGQPTLQDDEFVGETLKINLIPVEYRTRETLDSERLQQSNDKRDPFESSAGAFSRRLFLYNQIKGTDNTQLLPANNDLPNTPLLEWRPLAPTSTHDLFREITERQSLAGVQGGVFTDFFFDYDANPVSTRAVDVKVEAEATTDRGVILNPLTFDTADTQKDNTINVDLIKFKNHVIAQGNATAGTLPRELSVFSSLWEKGKIRREWDPSVDFGSGGSGSQTEPNQSEIRIQDDALGQIRFFKSIDDSGPSAGGAVNPLDAVNRTAKWTEDFVTIPPYDIFSSYEEGAVVTANDFFPNESTVRFYKAKKFVPNEPSGLGNNTPAVGGTTFWEDTGRSFIEGFDHELFDGASPTGLGRAGRTKFFSYTPWTQDFKRMRLSSLFGIEDLTQQGEFETEGYQGVVPDWNYIRAMYDREVADSRFEIPVGKDVQKKVQSEADVNVGDRHFGNRFLISETATGIFTSHRNQVAEWTGTDFKTLGGVVESDFRFSRDPLEGETVIDRSRGVWVAFDPSTNAFADIWNILNNGTGGAVDKTLYQQLFKTVTNFIMITVFGPITGTLVKLLFETNTFGHTTLHSPLHICRDIKLVEGATGVPGQAFEMRYDWSAVEEVLDIEIPNADKRNFSSIGAWWYMMFPYPKIEGDGGAIQVGDRYKRPYIDTNNLDFNSKGKEGWNQGLDSEDLGRIQRVSFKARLSLFGSLTGGLVIGYADMPMKFWAVDVFDRIWFADFKLRRNGEYSLVQLSFGEGAIQQIHKARYDELLKIFNIVLDTSFALDEKEWTGIEFDWRFVKGMGMFYSFSNYNTQGLYVANQFPDFIKNIAEQTAGQAFGLLVSVVSPQEEYQATDLLVNNARLAVDELRFEKQLYANSDRAPSPQARTVLDHLAQEVDYTNLSIRAQATKGRRQFVEQAWFMQAHGDVRLRFGEKFVAEGPRVPTGSQDLVCKEVKHIIDSDGYMMQITGKRKFLLGG